MEVIELSVDPRIEAGSTAVNRLRKQGKVPGVMYSQGGAALSICVDELHFKNKTSGVSHTHLYKIVSKDAGLNGKQALIKDMQIEAIKQRVLHVDFYEIHAGHKIIVTVPVEIVGENALVKQKAAMVAQALYEVEVECQPTEIPERIDVDVTDLQLGHSVFAGDLKLPDGVKLKVDKQLNILSLIVPKEEEAAPVAAATAEATPAAGATPAAAAPAAGAKDAGAKDTKAKK